MSRMACSPRTSVNGLMCVINVGIGGKPNESNQSRAINLVTGSLKRPSTGGLHMPTHSLTPRELQCVKLAANCLIHKEIAEIMGESKAWVDDRLSYARRKLCLKNEKELVHYALHQRWISNKFGN